VPRELKDREKINQMGLSLQHLLWYADEGEDIHNRIVAGDKSWVHHYQPKSKRFSVQWKHQVHHQPKRSKFKVTPSAGKVMLTMFWDSQGFQKYGKNVISASYCEVMLKLWRAIRRKCPGQLAREVLLH
jgi:hypothetical protein